ncbi:pyridoxine 5'-phosphate synthase [bacterium MnTg02]|nr:pyridoxine 5'-phosphate synthase [bacterium MnTg02]
MSQSAKTPLLRLGVNIDHVATIRNARGGRHPDPLRAAELAVEAGADGITAHLREDRRHISDDDIARFMETLSCPLNLEMAATDEMLAIALRHKPHACCIVPEHRQELTTEGGLDVAGNFERLSAVIDRLRQAGIRVSLFIDPDNGQIEQSHKIGADIVELHTGSYCEAALDRQGDGRRRELAKIEQSANYAAEAGLEVHAGHGLTFDTVGAIAQIPQIIELNIGHFLIGEGIFGGLHSSIRRMRALMDNARAEISGSLSA